MRATERQLDILVACVDEGTTCAGAERLGISLSQARKQLSRLYEALGVVSMPQAVVASWPQAGHRYQLRTLWESAGAGAGRLETARASS